MSAHFERAQVLMEQGRYDHADRELRGALAQSPNDSFLHALLSHCLYHQDKYDDAIESARTSIRCSPEQPTGHAALAQGLLAQDRHGPAREAIMEAIRLDPMSSTHWGTLSAIHLERRQWEEALKAAERGLQFDAEDVRCANLRGMALVGLGRKEEAAATVGDALRKDPENAVSHANQGWTCLHRGDHVQALEHFREALRLQPDLEFARMGLLEALKARYLVYRLLLRYFLWSSRLSRGASWAVVIVGYVAFRTVRWSVREFPDARPVLIPVLVLIGVAFLLTWIGGPLFNLLLRFNKYGRYALNDDEKRASNWLALLIVLAAGLGLAAWGLSHGLLLLAAVGTALMIIPVTHALNIDDPDRRRKFVLFAGGLGLVAAVGLVLFGSGLTGPATMTGLAFVLGIVAFQWIAIGSAIHR